MLTYGLLITRSFRQILTLAPCMELGAGGKPFALARCGVPPFLWCSILQGPILMTWKNVQKKLIWPRVNNGISNACMGKMISKNTSTLNSTSSRQSYTRQKHVDRFRNILQNPSEFWRNHSVRKQPIHDSYSLVANTEWLTCSTFHHELNFRRMHDMIDDHMHHVTTTPVFCFRPCIQKLMETRHLESRSFGNRKVF